MDKFLEYLCVNIQEAQFSHRDVLFDWNQPLKHMYFIKEGTVTLMEKAPPYITLEQKFQEQSNLDLQGKNRFLKYISQGLKHNENYKEISIRQKGQVIGEEYLVIPQPPVYKAVVSSEQATVVLLSFADMEYNLKSHEWYRSGSNHVIQKFTKR